MKKLNICLVSLKIPPDAQDGQSKFFKGIYDYLKGKGHKVKLLTGKWNYEISDPNIKQIDIIRKRFLWTPHFLMKTLKYLNSNHFDIVHGNGPKGSLPIFLSKYKHFISTIHDVGPFETPFTRIPFERVLISIIVKNSTYITTCSKAIKKEINYYLGTPSNKIFNLYSAIDNKFKPYPSKAKELKRDLGIEGPILLYIGRITSYKGVDDIIEAYFKAKQEIPNLNLVIGGKPDFSMETTYQKWREKYKDIYFMGFIPNKKLPLFYTMGDIFVTYSHASEGFGLTPIEAIACETPVICSSLSAYREVLEDNAIFVPPKRPHLLAEKIKMLLKDDNKRRKLTQRALKFIERYNWDSVGQKLEKVYYSFLNRFSS
jgi:hypothetical protein